MRLHIIKYFWCLNDDIYVYYGKMRDSKLLVNFYPPPPSQKKKKLFLSKRFIDWKSKKKRNEKELNLFWKGSTRCEQWTVNSEKSEFEIRTEQIVISNNNHNNNWNGHEAWEWFGLNDDG